MVDNVVVVTVGEVVGEVVGEIVVEIVGVLANYF